MFKTTIQQYTNSTNCINIIGKLYHMYALPLSLSLHTYIYIYIYIYNIYVDLFAPQCNPHS